MDSQSWYDHLPKAVMVYNSTLHAELGMSPSDFLLVKAHHCMGNPMVAAVAEPWKSGHPKFLQFKLGELVLMKIQAVGNLTTNKVQPNFSGPYSVTQVNSNGVTYQVKDVKTGKMARAHHSKLRPYRKPPQYIESHPYSQYQRQAFRPDVAEFQSAHLPLTYGGGSTVEASSEDESSSLDSESNDSVLSDKELVMNHHNGNIDSGCCVWCDHENSIEMLADSSVQDLVVVNPSRHDEQISESIIDGWPESPEQRILQEENLEFIEEDDAIVSSHSLTCVDSVIKLFDWSDSEQSVDWHSLPSIESAGMVDESGEGQGTSADVVDLPKIGALAPELDFNQDSFPGFESNDGHSDRLARLERLLRISPIDFPSISAPDSTEDVAPVADGVRLLRSRGPAPDLPWVMGRQLERKRRTRCSSAE